MHEAAEKVEREVERVAYKEDDDEGDDAYHAHAVGGGHRGDVVEHLRHNAAREHEGHDTRIRKYIAEPARQRIINAAERRGELAEALRVPPRAEEERDDTDDEHDLARSEERVRHAEKLQPHHHAAHEDDPQRRFLEETVHDVAALCLEIEADRHTGVEVDDAEHHRAVEHERAVVHGIEEIRQTLPRACGIKHMYKLIRRVAEETARQRAHDERGYAAVQKQLAEAETALAGLYLRQRDHRRDDHQQPVAHVRHHQPVEDDEERRHERVGIDRTVGGQRIHIRDHVQSVGELIVFQRHGDAWVFVLLRGAALPRAVVFIEHARKLALALRRHPALHEHNAVRAVEPAFRLRHGDLRAHAVARELQLVPAHALADNGALARGFLRRKILQRARRLGESLARGALHAGERRLRKAEGAQHLLHAAQPLAYAHYGDIPAGLVLVHAEKLRLLTGVRQRRAHRVKIGLEREAAEKDVGVLCPLHAERDVQIQPRLKRLCQHALAALLRGDALYAVIRVLYRPGELQCRVQPRIVQQDGGRDLRRGREKLRLCGGVFVQQRYRVGERGLLGLERHELCVLTAENISKLTCRDLVLDLRKLHAAALHELPQESVLLRADSHKIELFHF